MKIVINDCFGGFGLSSRAVEEYLARKGQQVWWYTNARDLSGTPRLREKVPTQHPDEEFIAYSYTSPEPNEDDFFSARDIERDDPDLVAVVEALGDEASGKYAHLKVVDIPDGVEWEIDEYDGLEKINEAHRTWS